MERTSMTSRNSHSIVRMRGTNGKRRASIARVLNRQGQEAAQRAIRVEFMKELVYKKWSKKKISEIYTPDYVVALMARAEKNREQGTRIPSACAAMPMAEPKRPIQVVEDEP